MWDECVIRTKPNARTVSFLLPAHQFGKFFAPYSFPMAFAHLFYGDYRRGEDPSILTDLETTLARRPHLSESEKCDVFISVANRILTRKTVRRPRTQLSDSPLLRVNIRFTFRVKWSEPPRKYCSKFQKQYQ